MLKKHFKWDITGKCNLRCKHCLTGDNYKTSARKELTHEQRLVVVDKLKSGGVHLINLLGGEPLILGEDLLSLARYCNETGMRMTLNTNGTLLTEEMARRLFDSGCKGLTVSIDGPNPATHDAVRGKGTFARTISNLRRLAELDFFDHKVSLTINTVLTKHNMYYIDEMLSLCLSLRAHKWILLPLVITGFAYDNKDELFVDTEDRVFVGERLAAVFGRNSKTYHGMEVDLQFSYAPLRKLVKHKTVLQYPQAQHCCMAGTTLGFIDPYGVLFPCDRIAGDFFGVEINGLSAKPMSLLDHDFEEIWNQPFYNELFKFVSSNEAFRNYDPCYRCEYLKRGLCIPCPLYGLWYEKIVYNFCLKAEKELGSKALCLDEDEQKNLFRYSGQFESLKREKVQSTNPINKGVLVSLNLRKPSWVRENVQPEAAELYNTKSDTFFHFNFLGKEIWSRIDTITNVNEILRQIVRLVPDQSKDRIYDSGLVLINELLNKELVEAEKQ